MHLGVCACRKEIITTKCEASPNQQQILALCKIEYYTAAVAALPANKNNPKTKITAQKTGTRPQKEIRIKGNLYNKNVSAVSLKLILLNLPKKYLLQNLNSVMSQSIARNQRKN